MEVSDNELEEDKIMDMFLRVYGLHAKFGEVRMSQPCSDRMHCNDLHMNSNESG